MRRALAAALLWGALCGAAWAAGPSVRVSLVGKQPVLVGQQVHLLVTVSTPNYFTSAPPFPPLSVPGAIVTMPDETGVNATESIGGVTYASIQKTYVFSAQQAGDFTLPPVPIAFTYGGDDGKPRRATVTLPPFRISAKLPPGAAAAASGAGGAPMPVARVTIRQRFDRPGTDFHVGDALVRTLDTTVDHTQAMMVPPPPADAPDGVRVFAADPVLHDETRDREGLVAGHRTDRLTYVFEQPGRYTVPAVRIGWFDAGAGQARTAEAPALVVTVTPGPARPAAIAPEPASAAASVGPAAPRARWRMVDLARVAAAGAIAGAAALFVARWLRGRLPGWRTRRAARQWAQARSEPVQFAAVRRAADRGDAPAAHAAALVWARHTGAGMSAWIASRGDPDLSAAWSALAAAAWAPAPRPGWDAAAFSAVFARQREGWRREAMRRRGDAALPALNP